MKKESEVIKEFIFWGRVLFEGGLVGSHSGNISVRKGERIFITRTGAKLGFMNNDDVMRVNLKMGRKGKASSEVNFHKLLYEMKDVTAVVHTHPPYTVALSFTLRKFIPEDFEGRLYAPEVPVVELPYPYNYTYLRKVFKKILPRTNSFIAKGHGLFTLGKTLEEAVHLSFSIEHSAEVYLIRRMLR